MPGRASKKDFSQIALEVVKAATESGQKRPTSGQPTKNVHAQALSKLGSKKGGLARAAKLSPKQRSLIAKRAAQARWGKKST